jgi:hypothetical protein|tara:strand:- start:389 stop:1255 length:867 start_codon:yes stop_codon:yes gene_type:complete
MDKIDFFGGCHGNFLEVIIDMFVCGNKTMAGKPLFNDNGAAHLKGDIADYKPAIKCGHYSSFNIPFDTNDNVIEVHISNTDMLAALTNSLVRAADEVLDITHLHTDTIKKLIALPKARGFLDDLIREHGVHDTYPKQVIRNYFYSKFDDKNNGLSLFNTFAHKGNKHIFPFSAFFNLEEFYYHLNKCAYFLNLNFYPTAQCSVLWKDFIDCNQGYQSQQKCNAIIKSILHGNSMTINNLTLVEEAWIAHRISKIFRCYNHPMLLDEDFPTNTLDISIALYEWKSKDYM